jgi:hypothetical protein
MQYTMFVNEKSALFMLIAFPGSILNDRFKAILSPQLPLFLVYHS